MTSSFDEARHYLSSSARPLEQALAAFHFDGGNFDGGSFDSGSFHSANREPAEQALAQFQNADGGFGNAIEPDIQMPQSSVVCTTVGLQTAAQLDLKSSHPIVRKALDYLTDQFDPVINCWAATPDTVNHYPHAPWWHIDPDVEINPDTLSINPGVEAASYFIRWGRRDFDDWLKATLLHTNKPEHHQLLCLIRLFNTPGISSDLRRTIQQTLADSLEAVVETDPSKWAGYCLKPLSLIASPTDFFAERFTHSIHLQLDYEQRQQTQAGAWLPAWNWGGNYPDSWEVAAAQWSSVLTLDMARKLKAFGIT